MTAVKVPCPLDDVEVTLEVELRTTPSGYPSLYIESPELVEHMNEAHGLS